MTTDQNTNLLADPILSRLLEVKLWNRVAIIPSPSQTWEECCWTWTGPRTRRMPDDPEAFKGHGKLSFRGKHYLAHRVAFMIFHGKSAADGLVIRHKCDNSLCCNPAHLETGSPLDNVMDRVIRGRSAIGKRNGAHTCPEKRPRGENHRGALITEETAALIKGACLALGDGYGVAPSISRHFNVGLRVVKSIRHGVTWKHVTPVTPDPLPTLIRRAPASETPQAKHQTILDPGKVTAMRKRFHEDQENKHIVRELSAEFGVSRLTVSNVLQCKTWADVETPYDAMPAGGHGMAHISTSAVQAIRATLDANPGVRGLAARLAEHFGTTKTTVGRIWKRQQHEHVPDDPAKAIALGELDG